jgi:hypothetical protein
MMEELDLTKPGKLFAKAMNEMDTTFHVVMSKPNYTKAHLSQNPQIAPADMLMSPFTVPFAQADKEGFTFCDLEATGRAGEIMKKVKERAGQGKIDMVKAIVIVTARKGNAIPDKQLADVKELKLIPIPSITLKPVVDFITVQNFKAGKRDFIVELSVTGNITQVQLTTAPSSPIMAQGKTLQGALALHVQEGQKYEIKVPAQLTMKGETQQRAVPRTYVRYVPGGWRTAGGRVETDNQSFSREVWTGTNVTLKAQGVGHCANIMESVHLRAESWASDWLAGPPPPPFYHNVC